MKRERRHELQHNALADWLGTTIKDLKPHANAIMAGVLLVAVAIGGYAAWKHLSHTKSSDSWDAFDAAWSSSRGGAADIQTVAEKYPGTPAGDWALIAAADMQLSSGCDLLFTNKDSAKLELRKAADNYRTFLAGKATDALRERATYGLARAHEALSDTDNAKKQYQEVLDTWKHGAFTAAAKEALDRLNQPPWGEFYDKFAKFDPKPPAKPDAKLPFDLNLPDEPPPGKKDAPKPSGGDIKLQSKDFGAKAQKSDAPAKKDDAKPVDKPAQKTDAKPSEAKPVEKPAEKTPTNPTETPKK